MSCIDELNKKNVCIHINYDGYLWRTALYNDGHGRMLLTEILADHPAELSEIMSVWGDAPIAIAPEPEPDPGPEIMTLQRAQALTTARTLGLTVSVADEAEAQNIVLTTAGIEPASTDKRPWSAGEYVGKDAVRTYGGTDYRCIQAHVTQGGWMPDATPALWMAVKEDFAPWVQPLGAHDAYDMGAKVTHGGGRWTSEVGGNVWEPGVAMWSEVA